MLYLKLCFVFLKIGLFNFGGGYAMISFIQNEVVAKNAWLTASEFTDIVAVSQMTPGPLGINMATYAGYAVPGNIFGSALATFCLCLPSFLLMLFFSHWLVRHHSDNSLKQIFSVLKPATVGLIAAAALVLCNADNFTGWKSLLVFAASFLALYRYKVSPLKIIAASGALGLLLF
ncbi:MAG: chromate transporter [Elusimicrobiales bacterium]|nr:chromate transporter [Elusimicrobiales bacterium]